MIAASAMTAKNPNQFIKDAAAAKLDRLENPANTSEAHKQQPGRKKDVAAAMLLPPEASGELPWA
jgi:hypothetical protein